MFVKLVCLVLPAFAFALERGDSCITPNSEEAKCTPINDCTIIKDALLTRNKDAIAFAKKSQCGYDSVPLVCCGTSAKLIVRKSCTTPNGELAFCIPLSSCSVIANAIKTGDKDALEFSRKSQCENGNDKLVCCGSEAYPLRTNLLPNRSLCGEQKGENRVWGGEQTELWEFPWMALLGYTSIDGSNAGFKCGGTLINERYILTAAHCVALRANLGITVDLVRLGEWKISTEPDCEDLVNPECADPIIDLKIEEKIVHPRYDAQGAKNDIALLRLEKNIQFTDYIRPICLPVRESPEPTPKREMHLVGWGATENSSSSDVKLKVRLPIVSREVCSKKIRQRGGVRIEQICAGGESGKDSCQGDSGGPLMDVLSDNLKTRQRWYQEGIVSWGVGCALAGYPAIYTRVPYYMDWIIKNLKPF